MRKADIEKLVKALDAIDGRDGERAHGEADDLLLSAAPAEIRDAYLRVEQRSDGFWYA